MFFVFFFDDTATTEIYTLSLHDALPISAGSPTSPPTRSPTTSRTTGSIPSTDPVATTRAPRSDASSGDRKSTRLNSSHSQISYAVFCLKKKTKQPPHHTNKRPPQPREPR